MLNKERLEKKAASAAARNGLTPEEAGILADEAHAQVVMRLANAEKYRDALRRIAEHFENCDIEVVNCDRSCWYVLKTACEALGWKLTNDQQCQIKFDRGE
jgi:hypothetical protein